jgi:cbb3-type cytochrome oxidase subunit 3
VAFIGLCLWAWSSRRREDFAAAARLALDDAPSDGPAEKREGNR